MSCGCDSKTPSLEMVTGTRMAQPSYFSISPSSEWTTDVTVSSKNADGRTIGQGVMTAVPLKRNRVTEYSGPLFTSGGTMSLVLNSNWETSETGSW